jgi:hypothetical protein
VVNTESVGVRSGVEIAGSNGFVYSQMPVEHSKSLNRGGDEGDE